MASVCYLNLHPLLYISKPAARRGRLSVPCSDTSAGTEHTRLRQISVRRGGKKKKPRACLAPGADGQRQVLGTRWLGICNYNSLVQKKEEVAGWLESHFSNLFIVAARSDDVEVHHLL